MKYLITILLLYCGSACSSQNETGFATTEANLGYLAQEPPSMTPQKFAPGLIAKDNEYEFGSIFNADATEFYYAVNVGGKEEMRYSKLVNGKWTQPSVLFEQDEYGANDPFLSPDEQRLYFISRRPLDGQGPAKDYDIWFVEKTPEGWSAPINAGPEINTAGEEYYISFNREGTIYFSSNRNENDFDIHQSRLVNGVFQPPTRLGDAINTEHYEGDVFVDPNENYLIFCAQRPDGYGRGDLYISFKGEDGKWGQSFNMGSDINSSGHELCPFVSHDGKYLFYTSNQDIYWVDAQIIQELKKTP